MADYKLTKFGVYNRIRNWHIPSDDSNPQWREYQEWLALGNTPDPQDPPPAEDTARAARRAQMRAMQVIQTLQGMTPDEAANYVEINVTDLASAKRVLKALAAVISILVKEL